MARVVFAKGTDINDIKSRVDEIRDNKDNYVNNAPPVISVAEVSSDLYDDDTYFRFVSNIKSGEGTKSLADLIKEEFGDELAKQTVQVGEIKTVSEGGSPVPAGSGSAPPNENLTPDDIEKKTPDQASVDPCTGELLAGFEEPEDASLVAFQEESKQDPMPKSGRSDG